jgi:PAS domain S-box-containing protein
LNIKFIRFRPSFTGIAGAGVVAGSIYFVFSWMRWQYFSVSYVYLSPRMPLSNTLIFLAFGTALLSLARQKFTLPKVLGLSGALIAALDLGFDIVHFGVDFDQVLSNIFYSDHEVHFLHMAPNSSTAIIFAGFAIFLLGKKNRKSSTTFIANLLGGLVLTLGLVSLFGYSIGIRSAYTWKNFVGMSVYTAAMLTTIGLAISFHALKNISLRRFQIQFPVLVAISLIAITVQLYRAQSEAEVRSVHASTEDRAKSIEEQLIARLNAHVTSFSPITKRVPVNKNHQPDGSLVLLSQIPRMIDDSFDLSGYDVVLQSGDKILFRSSHNAFDAEWTLRFPFEYSGLSLVMNITPLPTQVAKYQTRIPLVVLWLGVLFSCFFAYGTFLFIITREDARVIQDRLAWEQAISIGSDLIFVTFDRLGLVKSFNPAAEKFFGYEAAQIINRATPLLWHKPEEISNYARALSQELGRTVQPTIQALIAKTESGGIDRNEWTFITKSRGTKKGELSIQTLHGRREEIIGYVGIVRDMTEQRETEAKLMQSSKMASLGEMASGVAHEINNPLTIIQGRAIRLLQLSEKNETISSESLHEHVTGIVEMTKRIAKIIKGLAIFSRDAEKDPLEPMEINHIFEGTLELCRERFHESGIALEINSPFEIILSCRPTQISQVLLNLLNNAFDAVQDLDEKWVRMEVKPSSTRYHENWVEISVTDSGAGLTPAVAEKMMEPFFTTKEVGKGTGLGLSISRGIVEGHGGKIFLDSHSVRTRFVIELPFAFQIKS